MVHRHGDSIDLTEDRWKTNPFAICIGAPGPTGCTWLMGATAHTPLVGVEASARDHAQQNPGHMVVVQHTASSVFTAQVKK